MKCLKLAFQLFWCLSAFKDGAHCQKILSILHKFHLAGRGICNHRDTSNTSPNRIPWKALSSSSMECLVGCYQILPLRKERRRQDPWRKVRHWIVFLWMILKFSRPTFRIPMKNRRNDLCKPVCLALSVCMELFLHLSSPVGNRYRQRKSTNVEQFRGLDFLRFKQRFSSQCLCCRFPKWVLWGQFSWFNFLNPYRWLWGYFDTSWSVLSGIQKTFPQDTLDYTRVHHRRWVHSTIEICWYDCWGLP